MPSLVPKEPTLSTWTGRFSFLPEISELDPLSEDLFDSVWSIKRMPTEILQIIFEMTLIDLSTHPTQLLWVCRRWSRIVLGTPTLWTRLKIVLKFYQSTPSPYHISTPAQLDAALRRVGPTLLLDIHCNFTDMRCGIEACTMMSKLVLAGTERWSSFYLSTPDILHSIALHTMAPLPIQKLTNLESIHVICGHQDSPFIVALFDHVNKSANKCRTVRVYGDIVLKLQPFLKLIKRSKRLDISLPKTATTNNFVRQFQNVPELVIRAQKEGINILHMDVGSGTTSSTNAVGGPFPFLRSACFERLDIRRWERLPNDVLVELELNRCSIRNTPKFSIHTPALCSLTIRGDVGHLHSITRFVAPLLKTLQLHCNFDTTDSLKILDEVWDGDARLLKPETLSVWLPKDPIILNCLLRKHSDIQHLILRHQSPRRFTIEHCAILQQIDRSSLTRHRLLETLDIDILSVDFNGVLQYLEDVIEKRSKAGYPIKLQLS